MQRIILFMIVMLHAALSFSHPIVTPKSLENWQKMQHKEHVLFANKTQKPVSFSAKHIVKEPRVNDGVFSDYVIAYFKNNAFSILIALFAFVVTSALILLRMKKSSIESNRLIHSSPYDLEDGEYDFLGSEEGLPSKIDLIRAYINMNDHASAMNICKQIIATKKEPFSQQASELLASVERANETKLS